MEHFGCGLKHNIFLDFRGSDIEYDILPNLRGFRWLKVVRWQWKDHPRLMCQRMVTCPGLESSFHWMLAGSMLSLNASRTGHILLNIENIVNLLHCYIFHPELTSGGFCVLQVVSQTALQDAKQLILCAFDENKDGRIDISEVRLRVGDDNHLESTCITYVMCEACLGFVEYQN